MFNVNNVEEITGLMRSISIKPDEIHESDYIESESDLMLNREYNKTKIILYEFLKKNTIGNQDSMFNKFQPTK